MPSTYSELNQFPVLEEMGIARAHEISHYSLRSEGASKDVLKISYKRAKGSLLPHSRKYKFGRSLKTVLADGGTARMEHIYEISPFLLKAVSELDQLVGPEGSTNNSAAKSISEEARKEIMAEFSSLEEFVTNAESNSDTAAIAARFARLQAQIAAL